MYRVQEKISSSSVSAVFRALVLERPDECRDRHVVDDNSVGARQFSRNTAQRLPGDHYRSPSQNDEDMVALKVVVRPQLVSVPCRARLLTAVALHQSLKHPNIISLREVVSTTSKICLAMDFATAETLVRHVQESSSGRTADFYADCAPPAMSARGSSGTSSLCDVSMADLCAKDVTRERASGGVGDGSDGEYADLTQLQYTSGGLRDAKRTFAAEPTRSAEDTSSAASEVAPFDAALSETEAGGLFWQLVRAVSCLHAAGMVHRALQPDHVLLSHVRCARVQSPRRPHTRVAKHADREPVHFQALRVQLTGLGCAVRVVSEDASGVSRTTGCDLTETARSDAYAADMRSLGVLLHFMVAGEMPWGSATPSGTGYTLRHASYAPPSWVGNDLRDLLGSLMHTDPAQRPTAAAVLAHPWLVGRVDAWLATASGAAVAANLEAEAARLSRQPPTEMYRPDTLSHVAAECDLTWPPELPSPVALPPTSARSTPMRAADEVGCRLSARGPRSSPTAVPCVVPLSTPPRHVMRTLQTCSSRSVSSAGSVCDVADAADPGVHEEDRASVVSVARTADDEPSPPGECPAAAQPAADARAHSQRGGFVSLGAARVSCGEGTSSRRHRFPSADSAAPLVLHPLLRHQSLPPLVQAQDALPTSTLSFLEPAASIPAHGAGSAAADVREPPAPLRPAAASASISPTALHNLTNVVSPDTMSPLRCSPADVGCVQATPPLPHNNVPSDSRTGSGGADAPPAPQGAALWMVPSNACPPDPAARSQRSPAGTLTTSQSRDVMSPTSSFGPTFGPLRPAEMPALGGSFPAAPSRHCLLPLPMAVASDRDHAVLLVESAQMETSSTLRSVASPAGSFQGLLVRPGPSVAGAAAAFGTPAVSSAPVPGRHHPPDSVLQPGEGPCAHRASDSPLPRMPSPFLSSPTGPGRAIADVTSSGFRHVCRLKGTPPDGADASSAGAPHSLSPTAVVASLALQRGLSQTCSSMGASCFGTLQPLTVPPPHMTSPQTTASWPARGPVSPENEPISVPILAPACPSLSPISSVGATRPQALPQRHAAALNSPHVLCPDAPAVQTRPTVSQSSQVPSHVRTWGDAEGFGFQKLRPAVVGNAPPMCPSPPATSGTGTHRSTRDEPSVALAGMTASSANTVNSGATSPCAEGLRGGAVHHPLARDPSRALPVPLPCVLPPADAWSFDASPAWSTAPAASPLLPHAEPLRAGCAGTTVVARRRSPDPSARAESTSVGCGESLQSQRAHAREPSDVLPLHLSMLPTHRSPYATGGEGVRGLLQARRAMPRDGGGSL
eukprot:TRINITY_DN2796_c0_g1_i2.p1 TRINITY_DN2796_c0_g1~~TRINITY_DN2796_c0_g1_i2.p1  ORF type:complete len:1305 (+),score=146.37 TRINITY_DN2796_c0_g1_i2:278-4192(+)